MLKLPVVCRLASFFHNFGKACLRKDLIRATGDCLFDAYALATFLEEHSDGVTIWGDSSENIWELEWLGMRAQRSLSTRLLIAGYMEEAGEEYVLGGVQLSAVARQYGETLPSMLQGLRDTTRAAHGNLTHILVASEINKGSNLLPAIRLYVLNEDATRVAHVEDYGTRPRIGLALIPETIQGSYGHFELVDIAGMERLMNQNGPQSVGGNALMVASTGATSAGAVEAPVTATDPNLLAARTVLNAIFNQVFHTTLLAEMLSRSQGQLGEHHLHAGMMG
jgi:hypothetical protein